MATTARKTSNQNGRTNGRLNRKLRATSLNKYLYKVDHNVEIRGVRNTSYLDRFPFEIMKPGDSFLIPSGDKNCKNPNSLHYAAKHAKMRPGFTITTRLQLNKDRRVWRIK